MSDETQFHDDPTAPPAVRFGRAKLELMRRCKYAQKEKKQGVPYHTVDAAAIVGLVRPAFLDLGFTWGPVGVETAVPVDSFETKGGSTSRLVLFYTFRLTHVESGHAEDYTAPGEGADMGDKRAGKCSTYAQKYALMQMLLIETGTDDPDRHDHNANQKQQTEQRRRDRDRPREPLPHRDQRPAPAGDAVAEMQAKESAIRERIATAASDAECDTLANRLKKSLDVGAILPTGFDTLSKELEGQRAKIRAGVAGKAPTQPAEPETAPPAKRGRADELTSSQKRDQIRYTIDHALTPAVAEVAMHKAEKLHAAKEFGDGWTSELRAAFLYRTDLLRNRSPQFVERHDLLRMMKGTAAIQSTAERIAKDHALTAADKAALATLALECLKTTTFGEPEDAPQ